MFACDATTPGIAAVVVAVVLSVSEPAVFAVVLVVAEVVAVVAFDAVRLELAPVAAMQPVSANIATTLPVPTSRRERRAGWGLRRWRLVGVVIGGLRSWHTGFGGDETHDRAEGSENPVNDLRLHADLDGIRGDVITSCWSACHTRIAVKTTTVRTPIASIQRNRNE